LEPEIDDLLFYVYIVASCILRVLFGTYPWAFDVSGGGEKQLMAYHQHLAKVGVSANLFDQWDPKIKDHQLFHFFSVMPGSIQLCDHVKRQGLPIVISPNLWVTPQTRDLYPHQDIASLLPIADAIVVNSDMEGDALSEVYSLPRSRFKTVYNGVEEDFFTHKDPNIFRTHFDIQGRFVLNVANIEPRKNQLAFLRALKAFPDLILVSVGHIRDERYAQQCMEEAGTQLRYLGPIPYNSELLRSGLAGCEFFAMPSTLETPSIAALEAFVSGIPVLITREGSTTEYFGDSVRYVDPASLSSMRDGIAESLKWPRQPVQSAKYLWKNVVNDLVSVYRALT
jgi:glycosyltransferase involved in cell wall biosynthesis